MDCNYIKHIFRIIFLFFFYLTISLPYYGQAKADNIKNHSNFEIITNLSSIRPGDKLELLIKQEIEDGWYSFWKNPGENGTATRFDFFGPEGFEFGEVKFPIAKIINNDGIVNYGYEGVNYYKIDVKVPENIEFDNVTLSIDIESFLCNEICISEYGEYDVTIDIKEGKKINQEIFNLANQYFPNIAKEYASFYEENNMFVLEFPTKWIKEQPSNIYFFPEDWGLFKPSSNQEYYKIGEYSYLKMERDNLDINALKETKGVLYLGNNKGLEIRAILKNQPTQINSEKNKIKETGLITALFFAVIGGLILNLMPCVFPVLSMKALSLVKLKEKERTHVQLHGLAYLLGILVSFAFIAGILMILKSGGEHIGWGFQLQNQTVVMFLAWLLFIIGLNLSGFFELNNKLANMGNILAGKEGISGSFFTGLLAALVATPCTAPFMGVAMGYAMTQPPFIAMAVFLSLGFGLALPYVLLCFIPALQHILPKPGAWMENFRQFLAFPMYASAVWLVWVMAIQGGADSVLYVLAGFVLIALTIWSWNKANIKGRKKSLYIVIIAISLLSLIYLINIPKNKADLSFSKSEGEIIEYSKENLDKILREKANPVFVNMTAAWCITCKVNERAVLSTERIKEFFKQENIIFVQGDWTNRNQEIADYLSEFGRNGVPLYVFYPAKDPLTGKRGDLIILPQILTFEDIENLMVKR